MILAGRRLAINPGSPQARGLLAAFPCMEGMGAQTYDTICGLKSAFAGNVSWISAVCGQAILFDQSGGYSVAAGPIKFSSVTADWTISLLANISVAGTYQRIVQIGDNNNLALITAPNGGVAYVINGGIQYTYTSDTSYPLNTWFRLTITCNAGTVRYWWGSTPDALSYTGNAAPQAASTIYLGNYSSNNGQGLSGAVADVRIYARGLSASEVADIVIEPERLYARRRPLWMTAIPRKSVQRGTLSPIGTRTGSRQSL